MKLLDKMSPRDQRAVLLGGAALLLLIVVRWVLVPWVGSWQQAREDITVNRAQLASLESELRRSLAQRKLLTTMYGPAVAKPLESTEPATLEFVEAVQDVMRRSGIQEPAYQPQQPRAVPGAPGVDMVTLRMTGRCQLAQLAKCLAELRQAETLIVVDSLVASANPRQQGQVEVTMILSIPAKSDRRRS